MKIINEVYDYRTMLVSLVRKDLVTRYKGSVLGFIWTFINPLLQLIVYSLVFSVIMRINVDKYYIYLFVAFIPWFFISTSIMSGSSCILSNSNLVQKIYFPRIVIPLSTVIAAFVNMVLSMLVVFAALIFSGIGMSGYIVALPIVMGIQFLFVLGLVLIFSAVNVYFRDLQHILEIVVMAWFYVTPIVYTPEMVPQDLNWLLKMNPMTGIVESYRNILYYKCLPNFSTLILALSVGVISTLIGVVVFQKLQRGFAEEL